MSNSSLNDCRASFEAEMLRTGWCVKKDIVGSYKEADTQAAWSGWHRAWKLKQTTPERLPASDVVEAMESLRDDCEIGCENMLARCIAIARRHMEAKPVGDVDFELVRHGLACAEIFVIKNCDKLNAGAVLTAIKEAQAALTSQDGGANG